MTSGMTFQCLSVQDQRPITEQYTGRRQGLVGQPAPDRPSALRAELEALIERSFEHDYLRHDFLMSSGVQR